MTARRLYEVYFPLLVITADRTAGVPLEWEGVNLDPIVKQAHRIEKVQLFAKAVNIDTTPPDTPDVDLDLQYNLAENDEDVVAGHWSSLLALADIQAAGVVKSAVLADPLPRRLRLQLTAAAGDWQDGWNFEAWLVCMATGARS